MFGHCGQNMHGQAVGLREINGGEFDASFHQVADKSDIAGQSVKFAMISVAPCTRHAVSALASAGRSFFLPDSTSLNSPTSFQRPPFRKSVTAVRCASSPKPEMPCFSVLTR